MRILIAPNAFKNSLSARDVAIAIGKGLQQSDAAIEYDLFPVADGGDGTGELIVSHLGGTTRENMVHDPLGKPIRALIGFIDDGRTAVIEMANASGLRLLNELVPMRATSFGTGEQVRLALDAGASKIIIGVGGSATIDGGAGILNALGIRFLDEAGVELAQLPADFSRLQQIDVTHLDPRVADSEIVVLCDVDVRLSGAQGAAKMFGSQKGATADEVDMLEAGLLRFAEVAQRITGMNMRDLRFGGAAGAASAGMAVFLGAKLVSGIDYFLELTGFDVALEKADLVITGEGSIDEQTLQGKAPFGVAVKAKTRSLPVIAVAGKVGSMDTMNQYFDILLAVGDGETSLEQAIANTAINLQRTARNIGNMIRINSTHKR